MRKSFVSQGSCLFPGGPSWHPSSLVSVGVRGTLDELGSHKTGGESHTGQGPSWPVLCGNTFHWAGNPNCTVLPGCFVSVFSARVPCPPPFLAWTDHLWQVGVLFWVPAETQSECVTYPLARKREGCGGPEPAPWPQVCKDFFPWLTSFLQDCYAYPFIFKIFLTQYNMCIAKNQGSARFISQWSAAIFLPIPHFSSPEVNIGNFWYLPPYFIYITDFSRINLRFLLTYWTGFKFYSPCILHCLHLPNTVTSRFLLLHLQLVFSLILRKYCSVQSSVMYIPVLVQFFFSQAKIALFFQLPSF